MPVQIALLLLGLLMAGPTLAQPDRDAAAIRDRLHAWADAFNARDAERACELFADDVIAVIRGAEDSDKAAICGRLRRALAATGQRMRYAPDIRQVLVSGDLAAVLLVWTLTIERDGERRVSEEKGLDVFRRDPDGIWRIVRFMAFSPERDE